MGGGDDEEKRTVGSNIHYISIVLYSKKATPLNGYCIFILLKTHSFGLMMMMLVNVTRVA